MLLPYLRRHGLFPFQRLFYLQQEMDHHWTMPSISCDSQSVPSAPPPLVHLSSFLELSLTRVRISILLKTLTSHLHVPENCFFRIPYPSCCFDKLVFEIPKMFPVLVIYCCITNYFKGYHLKRPINTYYFIGSVDGAFAAA